MLRRFPPAARGSTASPPLVAGGPTAAPPHQPPPCGTGHPLAPHEPALCNSAPQPPMPPPPLLQLATLVVGGRSIAVEELKHPSSTYNLQPSPAPNPQSTTLPMILQPLHQPVILLGMHRSGTTLIAQLLDRLGLFLGADVQGDHEAIYFLEVNDLLLANVNAAWDNPEPFLSFLDHPDAADMSVRCMAADLCNKPVRRFLGQRHFRSAKSIERFDHRWGWKDPRNVFTLPLWLKIFPRARLINIVRNGIDVAASLAHRERKLLAERQAHFDRRFNRPSTRSRLQRAGYRGSSRCLDLAGGFSLWETYVARAHDGLKILPNPQTTVIYEQFLANPRPMLKDLADFCELPNVTDTALDAAVATVNPARAGAFLKNPELAAFYQSVRQSPWMKHHGYDEMQ